MLILLALFGITSTDSTPTSIGDFSVAEFEEWEPSKRMEVFLSVITNMVEDVVSFEWPATNLGSQCKQARAPMHDYMQEKSYH